MGNDTRCTKDLFDGQKYGTWKYLFEVLKNDTKLKKTHRDNRFESHKSLKVYMYTTGAKNGTQDIGRKKSGSIRKSTWSHIPKEELLKLWSPTEQK